jgi:anti-sigma factor (TIGR02949 family)
MAEATMPDAHHEIDCSTAIAELWDYLDQELTPERMEAVRRHLDRCAACLPHMQFGARFLEALHRCRADNPMPEELRLVVIARLKSEGLTS